MDESNVLEKVEQADMVLVGLGEDFDDTRSLRQSQEYGRGLEKLKETGAQWMIPAWNGFCREKSGVPGSAAAIEALAGLLKGRNHFAVSVSTDSRLLSAGRVVMPCGGVHKKQCAGGCREVLEEVTEQDREALEDYCRQLYCGQISGAEAPGLGTCPKCGGPLVLNNVYAEHYNEEGYLAQWGLYTKWLQGTLNRRLLVLELGVGMRFPTVIRWPFEKIVFFNQKAYLYQVNEKLYQLTKELSEKSCGISKNAIDWLEQL